MTLGEERKRERERERLDRLNSACAHLTSFYNCRLCRRCRERAPRRHHILHFCHCRRNSFIARFLDRITSRKKWPVFGWMALPPLLPPDPVLSRHSVSRHAVHSAECLPREYCVSLRAFYFSLQSHLEGVGRGGEGRARRGAAGPGRP